VKHVNVSRNRNASFVFKRVRACEIAFRHRHTSQGEPHTRALQTTRSRIVLSAAVTVGYHGKNEQYEPHTKR